MSDAQRDAAAEVWLIEQHDHDWYIGNATKVEWDAAYAAIDAALAEWDARYGAKITESDDEWAARVTRAVVSGWRERSNSGPRR